MDTYTYGSPEGFAALRSALMNTGDERLHYFTIPSAEERQELASALETAAFAGKVWAEVYTGFPVHQAEHWPTFFGTMNLIDNQVWGLVEALEVAYNLGDEFAGSWMAGLCEMVGIDWV